MLGLIANIQNDDDYTRDLIEKVTKVMLTKMSEGNPHGSGVALSYREHEGFFTLKSPNTGAELAEILELDKTKPFRHVMMHTRYATQGKISEENSHPHFGKNGALIHNGWGPDLYNSIKYGWHHKSDELKEKLLELNEKEDFVSECDTEALALIFSENPSEFAEYLTGGEVFALMNLSNNGERVTLYTQYNTVYCAYSHALGAVIMATGKSVVQSALDFLGEDWPISQIDHDKAYWFDGDNMVGDDFDFTAASMDNLNKYYSKYDNKNNKENDKMDVLDYNGNLVDDDDIEDLDVYFKKSLEKEDAAAKRDEWTRTVLDDGSVVWEHISGEKIHCDGATMESLSEHYNNMNEDPEIENVSKKKSVFLDKDAESVQKAIQEHIAKEMKKKI